MSRYVIYGAGGVGCLIGGQLHLAGRDVVLIARGPHGESLARDGLFLKTPQAAHRIRIPVAAEPEALSFRDDDTVVIAMKTQDAMGALGRLAVAAPSTISVVCAQNGVASERMALRLFERVYAMYVFVFAAITGPGAVCSYGEGKAGILDIGRYPLGQDERSAGITNDLLSGGFRSDGPEDIMAWKRGKLLVNLTNPIQAACAKVDSVEDLLDGARQEAVGCYEVAGLAYVTAEDVLKRGFETLAMGKVDGRPFPGGSTLQDLARGAGSTEVDYLNGEIVRLGRMHGIATPINRMLQDLMRDMVRHRLEPGSISESELRRRYEEACQGEGSIALPQS